jgi:hypothetical protein
MCPCYLLVRLNEPTVFIYLIVSLILHCNFQIDVFSEHIFIPSYSLAFRTSSSPRYVIKSFCFAVIRCLVVVEIVIRRPSKQRSRFDPRFVRVGSVVYEIALGVVSLRILRFACLSFHQSSIHIN